MSLSLLACALKERRLDMGVLRGSFNMATDHLHLWHTFLVFWYTQYPLSKILCLVNDDLKRHWRHVFSTQSTLWPNLALCAHYKCVWEEREKSSSSSSSWYHFRLLLFFFQNGFVNDSAPKNVRESASKSSSQIIFQSCKESHFKSYKGAQVNSYWD